MSLAEAKQEGADVSVVYSAADALELQKKKKNLVFFGLGFETTAPMSAWAIKYGLVVYSAHKLFPPAMKALLANKKLQIDGFINPGHVSAIIGSEVYQQFKLPQVIAGFEAEDVLIAVRMLLEMVRDREIGRLRHQTSDIRHQLVKNEYTRVVKKQGNPVAQKMIFEVFEICDAEWRGLGKIKDSGLKIKEKYKKCDVEWLYGRIMKTSDIRHQTSDKGCICGLILQGLKEPKNCVLFGRVCKPENPVGACMVSVEGACHVEYRFKV
jgi:hydrogenase expression/formation protein HypD